MRIIVFSSRSMPKHAGFTLWWGILFLSAIAEAFISCSPNPCKNGGHCMSNSKGESHCKCPDKYVGEYCQHLNPCRTGPGPGPRCQNGGTCSVIMSVSGPNFNCTCPLGYRASLCEIAEPNACDDNPCQNGATCQLKTLDTYTCNCPTGFRGRTCEDVDHCASQPCRNRAACESREDGYHCTCPPGFTGPTCTEDVDECASRRPCRHGTCVNTFGSYTCNCEVGYTGVNCESRYVPCDPSPCKNSGTCKPINALDYECSCPIESPGGSRDKRKSATGYGSGDVHLSSSSSSSSAPAPPISRSQISPYPGWCIDFCSQYLTDAPTDQGYTFFCD